MLITPEFWKGNTYFRRGVAELGQGINFTSIIFISSPGSIPSHVVKNCPVTYSIFSLERNVSRIQISVGIDVARPEWSLLMAIPIMDKHCPANRARTLTAAAIYLAGQNDVRDTESTLLDCFCAPSPATAGRVRRLPFSGGRGYTRVPPQSPKALHLRPASVVGRLDDNLLRLLPLLPSCNLLQSQRDLIHRRHDLREVLVRHLLRADLPQGP
jgi:hypothetical protein